MEDAFDTLRDNCYQISLSLKRIIKENVRKWKKNLNQDYGEKMIEITMFDVWGYGIVCMFLILNKLQEKKWVDSLLLLDVGY
jgi:hypothetical protein